MFRLQRLWGEFRTFTSLRQSVIASGVVVITTVILFSLLSLMHALPFTKQATASVPKPHPVLSIAHSEQVSGLPTNIFIPSLNINLPIIKGIEYADGTWTLTLNSAQFATVSSPANNHEGNTFIYAHYRAGLFKNLHLIQPGAAAIVTTDNGLQFHYTYQFTYALKPTDTSIFDYYGAPVLTLQTCSGAQFQNRQMFQFSFTGYSKVSSS